MLPFPSVDQSSNDTPSIGFELNLSTFTKVTEACDPVAYPPEEITLTVVGTSSVIIFSFVALIETLLVKSSVALLVLIKERYSIL